MVHFFSPLKISLCMYIIALKNWCISRIVTFLKEEEKLYNAQYTNLSSQKVGTVCEMQIRTEINDSYIHFDLYLNKSYTKTKYIHKTL